MTDMAALACQNALQGQPGGALLGSDWVLLSLLALLVSTLALTLVYMFASFLRNPQLISWSKFELFQVFATAVILAFFASVIFGICSFDMSFLDRTRYTPVGGQGQPTNMYQIIDNYFSKLQDTAYLIFGYLMYVAKVLTYMSRVTVMSHPLGVGSAENPLESMGQINSLLFVMLSGFVTSFLLLELQMRILDYLAFACLGYLFPMGIFFRCFEPTRSFGGTLLGLSIALFLFYPIIMVFNDYIMYSQIDDLQVSSGALLSQASGNIAGGEATTSGNAESMGQNGLGTGSQGEDTSWFGAAWQAIANSILVFVRPIMIYVIAAVVLPVINFILLIEITRGATGFLGDELDVSNLTRLI